MRLQQHDSPAWVDKMNTFKNIHRPLVLRLWQPQGNPQCPLLAQAVWKVGKNRVGGEPALNMKGFASI